MVDLTRFKSVLAFFAHPDDETLAAGGTMAKLSALGAKVHVAIPATGIHSRRRTVGQEEREKEEAALKGDCQTALSRLGVSPEDIYLGEFPDNEMDKHSLLEVIHWLEDKISLVKPDLILTHHRYCTNLDHRYCHEAAVVATRPALDSHITVLCAEVPSSTGYLRPAQWEPNFHVEISDDHLDAKVAAMNSYRSEVRPDPHPRSAEVIRALAKVRGSEAGYYLAEAFMVSKIFG